MISPSSEMSKYKYVSNIHEKTESDKIDQSNLNEDAGKEVKLSEKEDGTAAEWEHAEWEIGRRLIGEVEIDGKRGEEAAVREVFESHTVLCAPFLESHVFINRAFCLRR